MLPLALETVAAFSLLLSSVGLHPDRAGLHADRVFAIEADEPFVMPLAPRHRPGSVPMNVSGHSQSGLALAPAISEFTCAAAVTAGEFLPDDDSDSQSGDTGESTKKTVVVGVYSDKGIGKSVENLKNALRQFDGVAIQNLMAADIRSGSLKNVDVLIHPGGSGGGQGRHLGEDGRDEIRKFIREGGGFIGICAGAYLASADYEWSLHVLDAKVLDRKHWARGKGMVNIGLTEAGQQLLRTKKSQEEIFYAQGPLLAPANRDDLEDYETIASFKTEIAKKGAPTGVMKGTTAIAKGQYGRGQVLCFSPHPELTEGLEVLIQYAIEHVQRKPTRKEP